ncbi:flagellar basal-body MS-ring/collar protein FliF [Desulfobulbus alkaliphilus]|uniref:flagellar basal-body MS-ring/collar protein FliF n=1 Tax=Desulfobulbus alkaliphilus TaxID=869814 RepID=UPI001963FCA3|nr:flagellar basal-body MS-ring/collar protein FliF [Desulfobulbus alkaliphilus]MBM9537436.1 flagellar M-ring protein FliF [Desulfobulbus alkaliphilus]
MAEQTEVTPQKSKNGWQILVATIGGWPLSRQISLAAVTLICLSLFAFIIIQARVVDYQRLYGNLAETDASAMVDWLKGQNIPYRLADNGRTIMVPAKNIYETRLAMASAGLPQGGGVGFEIFDQQSFAITDFVQKVNYARALQGELARTIAALGPVETARVHLALPEKRLFRDQQQPATASVLLRLGPGRRLGEAQVEGIIHLVSSSIEGLDPEQVTVIDHNGNVLSRIDGRGLAGASLSPDMLEFQLMVEQRLEERAQALLNRSLGPGNSMVRVTATLDFSQTEKVEEIFDPDDPVIRSEQVSEEKSGAELVGGIPGVQANLDGNAAMGMGAMPPSSRSQRTTNYEISKIVSKTTLPVGTVNRLSVSVLVADRVTPVTNDETETALPRTEEELKALENMVASALGLDRARGDSIEVTSMPFLDPIDELDTEWFAAATLYQYMPLIRYGILLLGGLLLYFLLIRPLVTTLKRDVTKHYKTVAQLEAEQAETTPTDKVHAPARDNMLDKIKNSVDADPAFNAHVLRGWIQEKG